MRSFGTRALPQVLTPQELMPGLQFAAAFSSKQLPNVVTHLPSFAAQNYYGQGLLEPMDDVINAIRG